MTIALTEDDGVAIGEAFDAGSGLGWALAFGITMHRFADGVSVTGVMQGTQQSHRATIGMLSFAAVAPLAGVLAAPLLYISSGVRVLLLGWFAGVFLYLGATSLLPAAHEAGGSRGLTAYAIAGAGFIYIAQLLSGHIG